jgi:hypothetical protein
VLNQASNLVSFADLKKADIPREMRSKLKGCENRMKAFLKRS